MQFLFTLSIVRLACIHSFQNFMPVNVLCEEVSHKELSSFLQGVASEEVCQKPFIKKENPSPYGQL